LDFAMLRNDKLAMFPELTRDDVFMTATQRLWLRWPRPEDAAALARIGGDERVAAMIASWPIGATEGFARERVAAMRASNAAGTGLIFVIAPKKAWQSAIGLIGFNVVQSPQGVSLEGGYHLAPEAWGQGFMSEALKGVVDTTRLLTTIPRMTARVMPQNFASAAVLVKNGFKKTGTSTMTTPFRGSFPVDSYARELRVIGKVAPQRMPEIVTMTAHARHARLRRIETKAHSVS
jgi:RimJ/RimL family protein N-acetyltransferase